MMYGLEAMHAMAKNGVRENLQSSHLCDSCCKEATECARGSARHVEHSHACLCLVWWIPFTDQPHRSWEEAGLKNSDQESCHQESRE